MSTPDLGSQQLFATPIPRTLFRFFFPCKAIYLTWFHLLYSFIALNLNQYTIARTTTI
jgi:hypothetical protein